MLKIGRYYYHLPEGGVHPHVAGYQNVPAAYFIKGGTSLKGKTALVTGGTRGIGLAIVKSFLREGAKVVYTGLNAAQTGKESESLNDTNAAYMQWDISDTKNCESMMGRSFAFFGKIDILVNNAGISKINGVIQDFPDITDDYFTAMHNVNVMGTCKMCETYISLLGGEKGKIINIVSSTAFTLGIGPYHLSKKAVLSYTKALAREVKDTIIVNGIAPGPVKTDMMWEEGQSVGVSWLPCRRIGLPEEIAELAVILAGKKGDLFSGQVLSCDGGEILR
jgi:NAD(P)-dependent dehydrogenase (short-subunit alcohol dehydrogenase family)